MTLFRKVDPSLWDDEAFLELGDDAQSIWLLLLTGPQTCQIPGLQLADVYTLASARRWQVERVQAAIDEIASKKSARSGQPMAEFDPRFRIIRLPNAPRRNAPANPSVLVGWWKEWQRLPASPLKWKHIQSIKESVEFGDFTTVVGDVSKDMKSSFDTVWTRTFDTVLNRVSDRVSNSAETPCGTQSAHQDSGSSIQETGEKHMGISDALVLLPVEPAVTAAELEAVYDAYPRKIGKGEGIKRLAKEIRTRAQLQALTRAVENFKAQMQAEGRPDDKVQYFSTWANDKWRDWVDWVVKQPGTVNGVRRGIEPPIPHSDVTEEYKF